MRSPDLALLLQLDLLLTEDSPLGLCLARLMRNRPEAQLPPKVLTSHLVAAFGHRDRFSAVQFPLIDDYCCLRMDKEHHDGRSE